MILNHSNEVIKEFDDLIAEIQKSKSFTKMYEEYTNTLSSKQKQELVFKLDKVAKEIFCDINGGRSTTQSQSITERIKEQLGEKLYNKIVSTLEKYENQIYGQKDSKQSSFLFPTNEQLQSTDNKKISEDVNALNLEEKKIKSLEEIANMTENDARMENGVNYKHKKDKNTSNERSFFENVKTSKTINQDVKELYHIRN